MYETIQEEDLWSMWVSNPFREGSYAEWKESLKGDNRNKEQIDFDAEEGRKNALSILNNFDGGGG